MTIEIIVATCVSLLVLMLIIYKPYIGLAIFSALLFLRPADFYPVLGPLHITRLIAGLTFLVMMFKGTVDRHHIFKDCSQSRFLIIFSLIALLSITTSIWKSNSIDRYVTFLKILVSYLLIINLIDTDKKFKGIIWVMVLAGLGIGLTAILNYFQGVNLVGNNRVQGLGSGIFSNPNDLALCLLMLMPFAYHLILRSKFVFLKLISLFSLGVFLLGTIFTQSRGAVPGLLGMGLFVFFITKRKFVSGLLFLMCIVAFVSFAPAEYLERIKSIPTSHKEDVNAISRIDAWKAGISMMKDRPLGVGLGNFGEGFVKYRPPEAIDFIGLRRAAHNSYIQVGAETGVFGLLAFLLIIISTLKSLNRTKKSALKLQTKEAQDIVYFSSTTAVSMVGFVITVIFLSQAYNWILYYFVGFSVVLNELLKKVKS